MIRAKGVRGNGKVKILFPKTGVVSDFLREVSLSIVSGLDDPPTRRALSTFDFPLWGLHNKNIKLTAMGVSPLSLQERGRGRGFRIG